MIYSQLETMGIALIIVSISILCYFLSKILPKMILLWKKTQTYKTLVVFWPFVWKTFSSQKFKFDVFVISICAIGVRVTQPLIMKYQKNVMDTLEDITKTKLLSNENDYSVSITICLFIFIKFMDEQVFNPLYNFRYHGISEDIKKNVKIAVFEHLNKLDFEWHLNKKSGETLGLPDKAAVAVSRCVDFSILVITNVLDLIIAFIFLLSEFDIWFIIIIFTTCALRIYSKFKRQILANDFQKTIIKQNADEASKALDSLLNFETVKSFSMENYEADRYRKGVIQQGNTNYWYTAQSAISNFGFGIIIKIVYLIGCLLVANRVKNGIMTPGCFVLFSTYLNDIRFKTIYSSNLLQRLCENITSLEKTCELLQRQPKIKDSEKAVQLNVCDGKIQFLNVNFCYKLELPILKNINLEIKSGQTVGIVGPTGNKSFIR